MIEEIKKEILKLDIHRTRDVRKMSIYLTDVIEILDKYNNQPDYKSAWEELLQQQSDFNIMYIRIDKMEELSKKYNLDKE